MRVISVWALFFFTNICNAGLSYVELSPSDSYKLGLRLEHNGVVKRNNKEFLLLIKTPKITNDGCSGGGISLSVSAEGEELTFLHLANEALESEFHTSQIIARNNTRFDISIGATYMCDGLGYYYDF